MHLQILQKKIPGVGTIGLLGSHETQLGDTLVHFILGPSTKFHERDFIGALEEVFGQKCSPPSNIGFEETFVILTMSFDGELRNPLGVLKTAAHMVAKAAAIVFEAERVERQWLNPRQ